jgi:histidyl-tRNA synthetase
MDGPDIDAELILMTARMWKNLGIDDVQLQLNTLGSNAARAAYRDVLVDYLNQHRELLDEDSVRRLDSNPLRILDSKNPDMQGMIEAAPKLMDYLDEESAQHFEQLQSLLRGAGIDFVINTRLVRGLDYYCKTVFEWVTTSLGAQGTVCAGGRYDGLVEQLGGRATPAAGFAMGVERLLSLLEAQGFRHDDSVDVYLVLQGDAAQQQGLMFAEQLRNQWPELTLQVNCGGGSIKSQMKKADKSGASYALILAEQEINDGTVAIKNLREQNEQQTVAQADIVALLKQSL